MFLAVKKSLCKLQFIRITWVLHISQPLNWDMVSIIIQIMSESLNRSHFRQKADYTEHWENLPFPHFHSFFKYCNFAYDKKVRRSFKSFVGLSENSNLLMLSYTVYIIAKDLRYCISRNFLVYLVKYIRHATNSELVMRFRVAKQIFRVSKIFVPIRITYFYLYNIYL